MKSINDEVLSAVRAGDLDTLVELDQQGLLIGPDESLDAYANRLQTLTKNIHKLQEELHRHGRIEFLNTVLDAKDAIPLPIFRASQGTNRSLYDFEIDWVPGFYANYRMGFLFAGCAFYSYDDFFAVFIIRKAYKKRERWLIYKRSELMAHELCHIAHIGFHATNFEELFAYQTSESSFRRMFGGMLRTTTDTYLLLGSVLLLLIAQSVNVFTREPPLWHTFPMPLFFGLTFLSILFICLRYRHYWKRFQRARKQLAPVFGADRALPVLFRCSEAEIRAIAGMKNADGLRDWLKSKPETSVRWMVILAKYAIQE